MRIIAKAIEAAFIPATSNPQRIVLRKQTKEKFRVLNQKN